MRNSETLKFFGKNVLLFGLSKGVAFIAPILFLKFVSLENYGIVEYAYSVGAVIAVGLTLGLAGAYPYFILKKGERDKEQAFYLYGILIIFLYLLAAGLFYSQVINVRIYYIFLFSAIFALQRLYSSILKSNDKGYIGVVVDGGYYFILASVIAACVLFGSGNPLKLLRVGMEIYLTGLIMLFCMQFVHTRTTSFHYIITRQYPLILRYSIHLVLSGFIIYWLTSSARIYIKYLMGYEQVGTYSYYYRIAGIAVIIYLFFYIAYFKKLYLSIPRKLDTYFTLLITITLIACLACCIFSPFITSLLKVGNSVQPQNKLLLLLSVQMPLWVGISLNEGVISRENIIRPMNLFIGSYVIGFLLVMLLLKNTMTLELFTYINILLFGTSFWTQIGLLRRKQIVLRKCRILCAILMLAATSIYFFTI